MTGFVLLAVAATWLALAGFLTKVITSKVPMPWRVPVVILVVLALLPLPLIDEIVGSRQFERLCEANSTIHVDRAKAAGRTVFLAETPDVEIKGAWVPVVLQPWRFVDTTTGETLISYNTLMAGGGRLIHTLGISEGGVPLVFKGSCEPGGVVDSVKLLKEIGVTQIQRADLQIKR